MKTAYYTDQDFERFMFRSEWNRMIQFYVWLVCSIVTQFGIWYILLTNTNLSFEAQGFLCFISLIALCCLVGLWYCWMSTRRHRQNYQKMRQKQRAETHALLDELEANRGIQLNQD